MIKPQKHILIVDDSEDDRVMFAQFLTRQGYRTSVARDGEEALEKVAALQPHLILMDLWLPIISGNQVIQRLKADDKTSHVPILVITGNTTVRPPGCEGWLAKPCRMDDLGAEISRILDNHGTGSNLPPDIGTGTTPTDGVE